MLVFLEDFSEFIFFIVIDVEIVFEGSVESSFEIRSGFVFDFLGKEYFVFFEKVKGGEEEEDIFDSDSDGFMLKEF